MEIRPPKPPGKKEPAGKKKSLKVEPPSADIFNRMFTEKVNRSSQLENVSSIESIDEGEIEGLMELHQQFVASVNHEINNPLFVVRGMAEMIKDDNLSDIRKRILEDADSISSQIMNFRQRDIPALGKECHNAPFTEIAFRKDLVACYLAKAIGPLTSAISRILDDIEDVLRMDKLSPAPGAAEYDRIKQMLKTIQHHAVRIRKIIERLEKLLPNEIEVTKYVDELKMINLKND